MNKITQWFARAGALRTALFLLVVALIILSPFAGGRVVVSGWAMVTTLIAPTFYVILVFVLPLDIMMTWLFMSDKEGAERERFKQIIWLEIALLILLLLSWAPFVGRLVGIIEWE